MEISVSPISIPDILANLQRGSWLVPHFQRDFVWNVSAVRELLVSIIKTRPVGMVTLWAQADDSALPLEPISVPDLPGDLSSPQKYLVPIGTKTNKYFAILDGKQRCTALAMAFAGLQPDNKRSRYRGKYFLDTTGDDEEAAVVFLKESEIIKSGLGSDAEAISKGYFPFHSNKEDESIAWQWIRYIQELRNPNIYPSGLPQSAELDRRERALKRAFDGINNTRFAVLVVPDNYRLDEICDIFDKLNTTGTKVSTVDLIHSWLYADTAARKDGPVNLRQWMRQMEEEDGAVGWIDAEKRPELAVQFVTAAYVALEKKPEPRLTGGGARVVASIKSGDLLATPTTHWLNLISRSGEVAECLGEMQEAVVGGAFPWTDAPYPAASTAYFALAWKHRVEVGETASWNQADLNAVFRAFYWRNALTGRYDQGFLTKVEKDIRFMLEVLECRESEDIDTWRLSLNGRIDQYFKAPAPTRLELETLLKRGRHSGALQKALLLPMLARVRKDLLEPHRPIGFPNAEPAEIHHFFPSAWCASNRHLGDMNTLDEEGVMMNLPQSIVNLFPLSRSSNNIWKARHPAQVAMERNMSFDEVSGILSAAFIDKEAFQFAVGVNPRPIDFWNRRARLYADALLDLMKGQ